MEQERKKKKYELSCTLFHKAVLSSLLNPIICLAFPLRTKSASFAELVKVSAMSHSGPSPTVSLHGSDPAESGGRYKSTRSPTARLRSWTSS